LILDDADASPLVTGKQIGEDLILDDADASPLVTGKEGHIFSITQRRPMQIKDSRNVSHQRISPGN
jgi:hypothetical protein